MKKGWKKDWKEIRLKAWLLNHSAADVADQCNCTRDAIYKATAANRPIWLTVNSRGRIVDAYEYKDQVKVFGFK
jgi:hypothetical protein|tara:strand:- start:346 stop:567 length:222 start_codon:yes stop_codon:yes gene_type:complete